MAHELKLKSRIASRLAELHRSQGWLAKHLDVNPGYVSRVVRGKVIPKVSTAYKLAGILQCAIEDLWFPAGD